jgi:hypothetical protein
MNASSVIHVGAMGTYTYTTTTTNEYMATNSCNGSGLDLAPSSS